MALFTMSCSETSSHENHSDETTIELNESEKWVVNEEMTPFIENAENILNQYDNADYKNLAEQLSEQNQSLINSCTMDGKSHDELHKWLHPHLELVKALGKAENEEKANETISELKNSFETYHTYFQ